MTKSKQIKMGWDVNLSGLQGNTPVTESRCCHWFVGNLGVSASLNCIVLIRTIGRVLPSYLLCRLR